MSSALLFMFILRRIRVRCVLTVLGERNSSSAICRTVLPEAIIHITWYSRSDSVSCSGLPRLDRKSTRLNSSHSQISYAVFCLKKKKQEALDILFWFTLPQG